MNSPMSDHQLRAAFEALSRSSERVRYREYGTTAGGKAMFTLTIATPANLARLPDIERALRALEVATEPAARKLAADLPAIVWIGCGIHGDEISGPDAALELATRLGTATDAETTSWLDALVIHIDPLVNPEGRERLLAHTRAFSRRRGALDPQDLFHNASWPEGRGNHYLFDLNRDAVFTVQPESRARVAAVTAAMPQLYVDIHEMAADDTYLFAVPAEPLNPHLPAPVHDSWSDFAADHAAEFDRDGTSYYTRSWNEVFYPGFFDVWPAYHGAVPILYEQSATNGAAVRLPNGRVRTWREALDNQLRSARANLATAARLKHELLMRWWRARQTPPDAHRRWILASSDPVRMREVERVLCAQGIRAETLAAPVEVAGLRDVWSDEPRQVNVAAGSLCVTTAQPLGALVANLFDFHVPCSPGFLDRERRGLDLGGRTSLFDVTAWSLPLAFGIDAWWTEGEVAGDWRRIPAAALGNSEPRAASAPARYGYLLRDPSLYATARLLARGVRLRVACEAFALSGEIFPAGTLLLRCDDQQSPIDQALDEEVARGDSTVVAVDSARILEGADLGGRDFPLLLSPGIAVLTGAGFNAPGTGALWHLFDATIGIDVSLLEFARLESLELSAYHVLLLPEAVDVAALVRDLSGPLGARLRSWTENGGTLISIGKSTQALIAAGLGGALLRSASLDRYPPRFDGPSLRDAMHADFAGADGYAGGAPAPGTTPPVIGRGARAFAGADARAAEYREPSDAAPTVCTPVIGARLQRYLPRGAYLATDLHPAHWLRYGTGVGSDSSKLPVMCRESDAVLAASPGLEVVARYAAPRDLALSGLVWPEAIGYLSGTAYLTREKIGVGQLIAFAGDPVFRGYSLGTQRLLLNAVLWGPGFRKL